jgi:hypothetical protein
MFYFVANDEIWDSTGGIRRFFSVFLQGEKVLLYLFQPSLLIKK